MYAFASSEYGHLASRRVGVSAQAAFAFMSDPSLLGQWSLGCFAARPAGGDDGARQGVSLFGTGGAHVRIEPLPDLAMIRYWVGEPGALVPRISAFVSPFSDDECVVSMLALRTAEMGDQRWASLCRTHETELDLIKSQMETGFRMS